MSALVSVRGLTVRYPNARGSQALAVAGVSFDIPRGDTLALVGESGCGKTTTARAMLRLVDAQSGDVHFDGTDVFALEGAALRRERRRMQIVFQDPYASLNPRMRIGDAVMEGLLIHDIARGEAAVSRTAKLLEDVGLGADYLRRYPHELSGGQRQRVAIARALAVGPEFLVLDEAVSALDVTTQARILELFERLRSEHALTSLFIAHNLAVVQRVATTVAVMYLGRIMERAPVAELFMAPRHPYTRALIAAVPVPDPKARRSRSLLTDDAATPPVAGGCPFYSRCPHPMKDGACLAAIPPLAEVGAGVGDEAHKHVVACIKEAPSPGATV